MSINSNYVSVHHRYGYQKKSWEHSGIQTSSTCQVPSHLPRRRRQSTGCQIKTSVVLRICPRLLLQVTSRNSDVPPSDPSLRFLPPILPSDTLIPHLFIASLLFLPLFFQSFLMEISFLLLFPFINSAVLLTKFETFNMLILYTSCFGNYSLDINQFSPSLNQYPKFSLLSSSVSEYLGSFCDFDF